MPLDPISSFDLCVANRETGSPGAVTFDTIGWRDTPAQNEGLYWGAYSWTQATWEAQGGLRFAYHASEATPEQQSAVFNEWSRVDPGAWPETVPPCE